VPNGRALDDRAVETERRRVGKWTIIYDPLKLWPEEASFTKEEGELMLEGGCLAPGTVLHIREVDRYYFVSYKNPLEWYNRLNSDNWEDMPPADLKQAQQRELNRVLMQSRKEQLRRKANERQMESHRA